MKNARTSVDELLKSYGVVQEMTEIVMTTINSLPVKLVDYNKFNSDYDKAMNEILVYCGEDSLKMLAIICKLSIDAFDRYFNLGIDDQIYYDTFADIGIWIANHYDKTGEFGISEYSWLQNHIRLKVFRLGRLQFQPLGLAQDINLDNLSIKSYDIVLSVHIPQGEPLSYDECVRSYRSAVKFFKGNRMFHCHSWLLCPALKDLLQRGNIIDFMKDYSVFGVDNDCRQAEERIFMELKDNPDDYQEDTSLQRTAKSYLKSGKKLGCASGLFYFKD